MSASSRICTRSRFCCLPGSSCARLLYSGHPALHHSHRVQADDACRLRADPVRSVRQDRLCRRARAGQRDLLRHQGAGAGGHRRHWLDVVCTIHRRASREPADHRSSHGASARSAFPSRPRYFRPWHRQWHRVRRTAAWRGAAIGTGFAAGEPSSQARVSQPAVPDWQVVRFSGGARGVARWRAEPQVPTELEA